MKNTWGRCPCRASRFSTNAFTLATRHGTAKIRLPGTICSSSSSSIYLPMKQIKWRPWNLVTRMPQTKNNLKRWGTWAYKKRTIQSKKMMIFTRSKKRMSVKRWGRKRSDSTKITSTPSIRGKCSTWVSLFATRCRSKDKTVLRGGPALSSRGKMPR